MNHTVDSEELEGEVQPEKQEFAEMRSKPQFEVDIVRGDTTLGFTCSYLQEPPAANASADEYSMYSLYDFQNSDTTLINANLVRVCLKKVYKNAVEAKRSRFASTLHRTYSLL